MKLTALRADNPVGWMAACGALRLLPGARLRWDRAEPELEFDGDVIQTLAALPADRLASPELQFPTKLSASMPDDAWQTLKALPGDWALALGTQTETGMRGCSLKIRPGGGYNMVGDARSVLARLSALDVADKVCEALVGPWRYEDDGCVAWGFDAAARIDAATIGSKADSAPKAGVLGAYWLGWEALPLLPMVNGSTLGWADGGLTYATWGEWLDYPSVKALVLGLGGLRDTDRDALGVTTWFARFLETGNSCGRLSWATEVARTPSSRKTKGGSRVAQLSGVLIV
ncbi:hypothetical protein [uncultured Thiodictyon sp.]|uniref:hypothetical protein n=1 Tax=uncultured Thiodictyon sp. TaxID=1846217 RepID=UPI0025D401F4|nr:hypothetical protein [uncultured Thiodictyon sp.]